MSEKEKLVKAFIEFRNGNNDAFAEVYTLTQKYSYYVAKGICKNEALTEDVVQDAYISIYEKANTVKDPNSVKTWISMIVANTAKNAIKRESKITPVSGSYDSDDEDVSESIFGNIEETDTLLLPEGAMENKETQRLIGEILDKLPTMQKMVIIECEYNELKTREVAEVYGIPEGTVKTLRSKAKKFIKKEVENLYTQHNTKLYSVPMVPVLYMVIRSSIMEMPKVAMPTAITGLIAGKDTIAKTATSVVKKTKALAVKVGAGITSVAVIGGGIALYNGNGVKKTVQSFEKACNAHENEKLYDCFDDDIKEFLETNNINLAGNKDDTNEYDAGFLDNVSIKDIKITVKDIEKEDDIAYVLCSYSTETDTNIAEGYLRLIKDGKWKLDMSNQALVNIATRSTFGSYYYIDYLKDEFSITESERTSEYDHSIYMQ